MINVFNFRLKLLVQYKRDEVFHGAQYCANFANLWLEVSWWACVSLKHMWSLTSSAPQQYSAIFHAGQCVEHAFLAHVKSASEQKHD